MGYTSIMTPGFVRGMAAVLHLGEGRLGWGAHVEPAEALAIEGFPVYPYLETYYAFEGPDRFGYPDVFHKLVAGTAAYACYLPRGRAMRAGEIMRQSE